MSRFLLFVALSVLVFGTPAAAQPQAEFAAAMEANNYPEAERVIAAALERAQAEQGENIQTGMLAVTLASVRILQEKYAEAVEPGELGRRILESGGREALGARFLVARAALGVSGREDDAVRLRNLVLEHRNRAELVAHIHHSAAQLGAWAMREHRFTEAHDAWRIASETASNSMFGENQGLGAARVGEAAATLYAEADRPPYRIDADTNAAIQAMFEEGLRLLWRAAGGDRNAEEVSHAEQDYARGLAWYRVWRSYVETKERQRAPAENLQTPAGFWNEFADDEPANACDIRVSSRPPPRLPTETDHVDAGAAVVWVRFDAAGEVVERRVVAVAGGNEEFVETIERFPLRWRAVVEGPQPPACAMPQSTFRSVVFRFLE